MPDTDHYDNALALSPDGRKAIRLLPIPKVDASWSIYDPKPGFESWRIDTKQTYLTSPTYMWRLREYELVDTMTGVQEPLIPAPHGSSLAEEDATPGNLGAGWQESTGRQRGTPRERCRSRRAQESRTRLCPGSG